MRSKQRTPEINSGSMADISFLLLSFFLLTSNINSNHVISRVLSPLSTNESQQIQFNKRNVFQVLINSNNQLLVNGVAGNLSTLKDDAIRFLTNPTNDPNMSVQDVKVIGKIGKVNVSKGVISIQSDRETSYKMYINVQNELSKAINEIKDNLSRSKFGKKFDELDDVEQKDIAKAVPIVISEAEPQNIGKDK